MNQEVFLSPLKSRANISSKPFFISIDLEDFTYDTLRNLGLRTKTNYAALDKCYDVIKNFSKLYLNSSKFTFFTTGTLAREYPELVSRIHDDGNQISSHYNFHDLMYTQSDSEIEENILIAKESIKDACGKEPLGFRAPAFSIYPESINTYEILSKHFVYDSSYVLNNKYDDNFQKIFNSNKLKEFPIFTKKIFSKFDLKSGGTYFRLFSLGQIKSVMNHNLDNGFIPQVYLHPYDFLFRREFMVDLKSFISSKGIINGSSSYLRQHQWLSLRNKSTLRKLKKLSRDFSHLGTYESYLGL